MNQTERKIQSEERRRKSDEAQRFSEDRMQLLDTIREMIDIEFERRGVKTEGNPHPENPPPEKTEHQPSEKTSPCRTLWKRIVSLFTFCLIE